MKNILVILLFITSFVFSNWTTIDSPNIGKNNSTESRYLSSLNSECNSIPISNTPTIYNCPEDIYIFSPQGLNVNANWEPPTTDIDNSITSSHNSGDLFPLGITIVTYTATDSDNLTTECQFRVIVHDTSIGMIDGTWNQIGDDIIDDSSNPIYEFGRDISIDANGNTIIIGANGERATAYENNNGSWLQLGDNFTSSDPNQYFSGYNVSLSNDGTVAAVMKTGRTDVYTLSNNNWIPLGNSIEVSVNNMDANFYPIALSGNGQTITVGRIQDTRVYELISNVWTLKHSPINFGGEGHISMNDDGSIVAISSGYSNIYPPAIKIYESINNTWVEIGNNFTNTTDISFNGPLELNAQGNCIALGASYDDTTGFNDGAVNVFEYNSGNWTQLGQSLFGESDLFGSSVSLNSEGNILAVGGFGYSNGSGAGLIFKLVDGLWYRLGNIINADGNPGDYFGHDISLDEDGLTVAVSSKFNDPNSNNDGSLSGYVRIYDFCQTPVAANLSYEYCSDNSTVTISFEGDLIDADSWAIYEDSCDGTPLTTSTTNSFDVTLTSEEATYYIKALGGCSSQPICSDITINNNPQINDCPEDIIIEIFVDESDATVTWDLPTVNENCSTNLASTHESGDTFPIGTTQVTYTATDNLGNSSECSFNVTVSNSIFQPGQCESDVWSQVGDNIDDGHIISSSFNSTGSRIAVRYGGNNSPIQVTRVYDLVNGIWSQFGDDISNSNPYIEEEEVQLSADGNTLAIHSTYDFEDTIRVYKNINNNWELDAYIDAGDNDYGALKALCMNANGNVMTLTEPSYQAGNGVVNYSNIRVIEKISGIYAVTDTITDKFLWAEEKHNNVTISSDGSTIAIRSKIYNYINGNIVLVDGDANFYEKNANGEWLLTSSITTLYGSGISLNHNGTICALNLKDEDNDNWVMRLYQKVENNWIQYGNDYNYGTNDYYSSNGRYDLSEDAEVLAISKRINSGLYELVILKNNNGVFTELDTNITYNFYSNYDHQFLNVSLQGNHVMFRANINGTYASKIFSCAGNGLTIDENTLASITIFPNPTSQGITIKNSNMVKLNKATIYDLTGRLIKIFNFKDINLETSIDISELNNAMYLLKIEGEFGEVTKQLIKH